VAFLPEAVRRGSMLPGGAGRKLNRFTTAAVAANRFTLSLAPGRAAAVRQGLLYVADGRLIEQFRRASSTETPTYEATAKAFRSAAKELIRRTPGAADICKGAAASAGEAEPFGEKLLNFAGRLFDGVGGHESEAEAAIGAPHDELRERCADVRPHGPGAVAAKRIRFLNQ